jgi:hypothetical protein
LIEYLSIEFEQKIIFFPRIDEKYIASYTLTFGTPQRLVLFIQDFSRTIILHAFVHTHQSFTICVFLLFLNNEMYNRH